MKYITNLLAILTLLISFAGCDPTNVNEGKDPTEEHGGKPDDKPDPKPDDGQSNIPTDEYYKGWNTTGEYVVPDKDSKINPNLFITNDGDVEVVSLDTDNYSAVLRFKNDVPKLYRGAVLLVDLSGNGDDMPIFLKTVEMDGNEASVQFRFATLGEIFFNRNILLTTDPYHEPVDPDVEVYVVDVDEMTKASKTPFLDFQKTYEMFDPKLTVTTIENKFETDIDYYFSTDEPKTGPEAIDEELLEAWEDAGEDYELYVNEYTEADVRNSYVYLIGETKVTTKSEFEVNLNDDWDIFEKKLRIKEWNWFPINGHIGVVKIKLWCRNAVDAKINCGIQGTLSAALTVTVSEHAKFGASYDGKFHPLVKYDPDFDYKFDPPKIKSAEVDVKIGPELEANVLAYGFIGLRVQPFLFFGAKYTGTKWETANEVDDYYGVSGEYSIGFDMDASVILCDNPFVFLNPRRDEIKAELEEIAKWPKHDPIVRKPFYKFPEKVEPKQEDVNMILGYDDKLGEELPEDMRMCIWDKSEKDDKAPAKAALVRLRTLSTMPPGTTGTFQTKEGRTCHKEEFFDADDIDDLGELVVDFEVPGPQRYDYTFRADIIDGEGNEISTCNLYPLNRFKSYTAKYSASECDGETVLTIEDYGKKLTEKGRLTRTVVYDGFPIQATYIVDSDFEELFEMGDIDITESKAYVTYYMKYYAGECLYDPVIDNLDYIRWDQDVNSHYQGFQFAETNFYDMENCVHATGPASSVFFPKTDITYWMNMPVKVATGYLDPECTKYSYLTLKSYELLDDSSEDRQKQEGETEYEPNEPVSEAELDDDGTWGGFNFGGGGGDDDDMSGYYVRVNEEPETWEGKYIIVYDETKANSWEEYDSFLPGNLTNIYGSYNGQGTYAEDGHILVTSANENSYFTICKLPDGKYAIYSSKDFYLGCKNSASAAFDKWAEEPVPHTITYDAVNKCALIQSYYNHTLCYDDKYSQFIYATWADYSAGKYKSIQLFKLHE